MALLVLFAVKFPPDHRQSMRRYVHARGLTPVWTSMTGAGLQSAANSCGEGLRTNAFAIRSAVGLNLWTSG